MSAKLVVQKFVSDNNIKYLNITIEDENDEIRFGEWLEGESLNPKKVAEKSSHLVVKIVSGQDNRNFDLDLCAKQVDGAPAYNGDQSPAADTAQHANNSKESNQNYNLGDQVTIPKIYLSKNLYQQNNAYSDNSPGTVCPLEYSLERVKKNNARIMESIHMLNRTLNYTKRKETLDINCPRPVRSYTCDTCGKCFVYETGLRRHYSTRHAILDIQPRWQVVWTCIECFQVWPRQDVAMQHATRCSQADDLDCVREIKTSSLLQCEFCERVFTSIPRLLRHAKTHTTATNYECNACKMAFSSYKTAEQHWLSCPWLKTCYTFHLAKLLLCNACDRKFRNYEQLYNHRYKVGHFITKTHCNQSHIKTLGILVYQCEICGQWFASVAFLLSHRSQNHPRYDSNMLTQCDSNYMDSCNLSAENNMQEFGVLTDQEYLLGK